MNIKLDWCFCVTTDIISYLVYDASFRKWVTTDLDRKIGHTDVRPKSIFFRTVTFSCLKVKGRNFASNFVIYFSKASSQWHILPQCLECFHLFTFRKITKLLAERIFFPIMPVAGMPSRSQWPRGLRRRSAAARLLRSWVRIPPGAWMFVCYECCVLSGRGLCDELITRQQESYRLWCVVVCDLENLKNEEAMTRVGSQRHKKKPVSLYRTA